MSTVVLDTITGKSTATTITIGSTPVVSASANSMTIRGEGTAQTSIQQGLAKAWCYGSGAAAVTNSLNVSGGTDNGAGDYTYTLSSALANANEAATANSFSNGDKNTAVHSSTTLAYSIAIFNQDGSRYDVENGSIVHGDLA
jgi:hypothetical protein